MRRATFVASVAGIGLILVGACGGCGQSSRRAGQSVTSTTAAAPPPSSAPTGTTSPTTTFAGPSGGLVPPGFQVQSATFVSDLEGWVLGTSRCASPPCTSLARTTDGGVHWRGIPAPRDVLDTPPSPPDIGVGEVRFADPRNGWVFGPDLWSTHDGGATWDRVASIPASSRIVALEASAGRVDAVVTGACRAGTSACAATLWTSSVSADGFTQVPGVDLPVGEYLPNVLSLHGSTGYLVAQAGQPPSASQRLWITTDESTWTASASPCPSELSLDTVGAVDARRAVALCVGGGAAGSTAKAIEATSDTGSTFVAEGTPPPREGDGGTIAAASASALAVATSSGAAEIYRSAAGGATWTIPYQVSDGGVGFGDFGFTDAYHGLAVHAPAARVDRGGNPTQYGPDLATLLLTADGARTWNITPIRN